MSERKSQVPVVNTVVGETFDITLQSMQGSSGYGWHLAKMPRCLTLLSERMEPVFPERMIGPVRHIFTFVAVSPCKDCLEFSLLAVWKPLEVADTQVYEVSISKKKADAKALESEIGSGKFVSGVSHMRHMQPVPPYGFPSITDENGDPTVHLLYGFPPPCPDYGFPQVIGTSDKDKCVLMYGVPWGMARKKEDCILKYGFPVAGGEKLENCFVKYGFPPVVKYGCPPVVKYGFPTKVVEDKNNCVVKYGTPGGISKDPQNCVIRYGVPIGWGSPSKDK